ncbi:MAG: trypsin-like peptidase domain-containing protein [Planctomycetota bacterium]
MRLNQLTLCMLLVVAAAALADLPDDDPRITPEVRAYRKTAPAVVNISTQKVVRARMGRGGLFDEIFPSPFSRNVKVRSLGSGFCIHPDGYIVTNAHVVRKASEITVTLSDNKTTRTAQVISVDPKLDLAVIKIDPPEGKLSHLPLARSDDLIVGERVIAIGNPLGYANSLTTGVISATNRKLEFDNGLEYPGLIQIDAPINPGNSGGALLNIKGELIGINTAIRADAQNIGFAIPIDMLADQLPLMLDFERIQRASFGARVVGKREDDQVRLVVDQVRDASPAAGKLQVGDRVLALDGKELGQISDYYCGMLSRDPARPVRLTVRRAGEKLDLAVQMQVRPRPDGLAMLRDHFGLDTRRVDAKLARELRLFVKAGLVVTKVRKGSAADRVGILPRDVVFQIDRFYVTDGDSAAAVLEDVQPGQKVRIGIIRRNVATWVALPAEADRKDQPEPGEQI